jgi:hypothetical protein
MAMTANLYYPETKRWRAGLALVLILAAHLALFWFALARTPPDKSVNHDHALPVWMLPSPKPVPKTEPLPINTISTRTTKITSNTPPRQAEAPKIRSIPTVTAPPSLEAPPNPVTGNQKPEATLPHTTGLIHTDLAKITRELEKESKENLPPNRLAEKYGTTESKLAQGIAQAYRGSNAMVSMTNITLPDGRIMTKVSGPLGSYCAFLEPVNGRGGRDPIQGGVRTLVVTCPN